MSGIINEYNLASRNTTEPGPVWFEGVGSTFFHTHPPSQTGVYTSNTAPLAEVNDHPTSMPMLDNPSDLQLNDVSLSIPTIPVLDMNPPPRGTKRKKKASVLHEDVWELYKARIIQLYVEQDKTMKDLQSIMKAEYGFDATRAQYLRKVKKWKKEKNVKFKEMQVVVRKRQFRKLVESGRPPLHSIVRGKVILDKNIKRWIKGKNHPEDALYLERPDTVTDPEIVCRTISDHDLAPSSRLRPENLGGPLSASEFEPAIQDTANDTLFGFGDFCGTANVSYPLDFSAASMSQILDPLIHEQYNTILDGLGSGSVLSFDSPTADQSMTKRIEDNHDQPGETSSGQSAPAQDPTLDSYGESNVRTAQRSDPSYVGQSEIRFAEAVLRPSRADYSSEAYGKENFMTSIFRLTNQLWRAQDENDNADNARPTANQCLEHEKTILSETPVDEFDLVCAYYQSQIMMSMSRGLQAEKLLASMIRKAKRLLGEDRWLVLLARADLASIYQQRGIFPVARAMQFDVLRRSERVLGTTDFLTVLTIWDLSKTYGSQGSLRIAEKLNLRAISLSECILEKEHISILDMKHSLGRIYQQQGRLKDAERLYTQMREGYLRAFGPEYGVVLSISQELEEVHEAMKRESHSMEQE